MKKSLSLIKNIIIRNYLMFGSSLVLLLYFIPFIIYGESSPILIYDNADSFIIWQVILAKYGFLFGSDQGIIYSIMGGVPLWTLDTEYSIITLLFSKFSPFLAYLLNLIFIHLIGYIGMYLLLSNFFIPNKNKFISYGVALCFALIPFWPQNGIGVSGLPLIIYIFLKFRENNYNLIYLLIILLFPFYSSFAYIGIPLLIGLFLIWIYDIIVKKQFNIVFILALILITVIYSIVEHQLLLNILLNHDFISVRNSVYWTSNYYSDIKKMLYHYLISTTHPFNEYEAWSFQFPVIILTLICTIIICILPKYKKYIPNINLNYIFYTTLILILFFIPFSNLSLLQYYRLNIIQLFIIIFLFIIYLVFLKVNNVNKSVTQLKILFSLIIIISITVGFEIPIDNYISQYTKSYFQIRFFFYEPIIWMIIFSLSLNNILDFNKNSSINEDLILKKEKKSFLLPQISRKNFVILLILIQILYLFCYPGGFDYYQSGGVGLIIDKVTNKISFEEYYSPNLFLKINQYINEPQNTYKVGSIGLDPAIATYNGYYTIDGYDRNYLLSYKLKFRKIIEKELIKIGKDNYYDNWGIKCYLYISNISNERGGIDNCMKKSNIIKKDLSFNASAFRELGGNYIFSAVEIENSKENNLIFLHSFIDNQSPWKIWLYKVK
jgi:hypothetical protein